MSAPLYNLCGDSYTIKPKKKNHYAFHKPNSADIIFIYSECGLKLLI